MGTGTPEGIAKFQKAKKSILNRIKTLKDIEGVTVLESTEKRIEIRHSKLHGLNINIEVVDNDHYVVYLVDAGGKKKGLAFASIWSRIDAIKFVSAYLTLNDIRARRQL